MSDKITTARIAQIKANEIAELRKLYGDKSEQYVAERLAHEETRKSLSGARAVSETLSEHLHEIQGELTEAQASLLGVEEALKQIEKRTHDLCTFGALERAIDFIRVVARTALSPHKET